jgi:hypothetical protein
VELITQCDTCQVLTGRGIRLYSVRGQKLGQKEAAKLHLSSHEVQQQDSISCLWMETDQFRMESDLDNTFYHIFT